MSEIAPMQPEAIAKLKAAVEKRWAEKPWYQGGEGLGSPACMMRAEEILSLIAAAEQAHTLGPAKLEEGNTDAEHQ